MKTLLKMERELRNLVCTLMLGASLQFLSSCTLNASIDDLNKITLENSQTPVLEIPQPGPIVAPVTPPPNPVPTAPTSLTLQTPATSPGIVATPIITVNGVTSGDTVKLYSNSACTTLVGTATASATSANVTTSTLADGTYSFYATTTNANGTSTCSTINVVYDLDLAGPNVVSVIASTAAGTYKSGASIVIQVTFDKNVVVDTTGGVPRIQLDVGGPTVYATFTSGSGTTVLDFTYTVAASANSADLEYSSVNALTLNSGTMKDSLGNDAVRTLPTLATAQSLAGSSAIVIDTTNPSLAGTLADGTYINSLATSTSLSWTAATDVGGSGISKYQIALGTTSGGTNIVTWTDIGDVTTYQFTGLTLTNNTLYYPTLRAVDNAGNTSSVITGNGFRPDTAAPTAPGTFDDGIKNTELTESPPMTWEDSTDGGSGISFYEVAIGTTSGGNEIQNWTSAGNNLTYVSTSLSLTVGTTYYSSVRAVDAVGNRSTVTTGNGWNQVPWEVRWTQQAYVKPANPSSFGLFGRADISGDTMVVGAGGDDSNQTTITNGTGASSDTSASSSGAVFIYKRTGTTWVQEAYIKASNADGGDSFGSAVGISGDIVAVGAYTEASNQVIITNGPTASSDNSKSNSGAVYVYKRTGSTWAQEAYLKASNADIDDMFGLVLAIDGDTIVVGASKEDSSQTSITNGSTSSANNTVSNSGAAYIFKRTGSSWAQQAYLKAANGSVSKEFGNVVAIHQDTVVVTAKYESSNQTTITNGTTASSNTSTSSSGAVYVYKRTGNNWAQEAYIKPPNPDMSDYFGNSLDVYGDTIVVGCESEDSNLNTITNGTTASADNSSNSSGAAFVYKRNGVTWAQEAFLKASNAGANDGFGRDVQISGDVIWVSATGEQSPIKKIINAPGSASLSDAASSVGAVYSFKRTGNTWHQEAYVKAVNSVSSLNFGNYLGGDGNTFVVGTAAESSNQTTITNGATASTNTSISYSGAVYVYTAQRAQNWQQQAYVKSGNSGAGDAFGNTTRIHNNTMIVGAHLEDSNVTTITNGTATTSDDSAADAGAVYIYKRNGVNWAQEAFIKAENAEAGDHFGASVDINDGIAIVGAPGESSNVTAITNGTTTSSDNSAVGSGAAYVYKRTANAWAQEAYLKAPNAQSGDEFGSSVAVHGSTAVVGSPSEDSNQTTITNSATASSDNSASSAGAVYVFIRSGVSWAQQAYLKAANAEASDVFGKKIAIHQDTIVVGAPAESSNQITITNGTTASSNNTNTESGAAYVFVRSGATWTQQAYLKAANNDAFDRFGENVAVYGDTIVVGAPSESSSQTTITNAATASSDNSQVASGAVYVYKRSGATWTQQAYLKASNSEGGDNFGMSVAVNYNTVVVGATGEDSSATVISNDGTAAADNISSNAGAVYVFERTGNSWAQISYIKAPNADSGDQFGQCVSVDRDSISVGAPGESSSQTTITNGSTASVWNTNAGSGAVYIFKR